jgi:hypothetical protein
MQDSRKRAWFRHGVTMEMRGVRVGFVIGASNGNAVQLPAAAGYTMARGVAARLPVMIARRGDANHPHLHQR